MMRTITTESLLISLLVFLSFSMATGQKGGSNCAQKLISAQRAYNEGELEIVISLITPCLNTYKYTDAIDAYKLMVLTYIFLDQPETADEYYSKLLDKDPNFIPNLATDPVELMELHNSFRVSPRFTAGITVGGNLGLAVFKKEEAYRIDGLRTLNRTSTFQFGTQFGAGGEWYISNDISFVAEFYYASSQIKFSENLFESDQLTYVETQQWLSFPLSARHYFGKKNKSRVFIELGGALNLLQQANANVERIVQDSKDVSGPEIDVKSLRNEINYSASAGLGIRKSVGKLMVFAKIGVRYDWLIQNNPDNRYGNSDLIYQYGYVDEDFKVLSPSLSIGLSYAFYSHKRKVPRIGKIRS